MAEGTMRAVVIPEPGPPEVLEVREVPRPDPGPGEVRVRVAASGVNRADLLQRRGAYPAPPGAPSDIPGLEYAGVVDAVGSGVRLVAEGDAVMGLVAGGGYAEAVVVHERETVPIPQGMDPVVAAALPEAWFTAWDAVVRQMRLTGGETALVHAVGSGVGTAALQIARALGARVLGTSRTPWKLERAGELGLDEGIVGGADRDWAEEVLDRSEGRGADLIVDLVGGSYLAGNLRCVAPRGRIVVVGVPGGREAALDLRGLMARRASITGTVLRARPLEEKIALARDAARRLVPLFERGALRPVEDRRFPPEEAAEAHRVMEANLNFGTLSIVWTP